MIAARTTHWMYAAAGAPQRAEQPYVGTLIVRTRLLCAATRLRAYLPPEMAARLAVGPPELAAPMHPSQVAFAKLRAAILCGACHRALDPVVKAGVALRARAAERLAALAEANARAPWTAAIAFARAAQRAARGGALGGRDSTNCAQQSYTT